MHGATWPSECGVGRARPSQGSRLQVREEVPGAGGAWASALHCLLVYEGAGTMNLLEKR